MIDIKLIREDAKKVKENIKRKFQKGKVALIDKVVKLDEKWRNEKKKIDDLRHERNKISQEINKAKKEGNEKKAKELIKDAKGIPGKIVKIEEGAKKFKKEVRKILIQLPNIIHKSVPIGKDDTKNKEIKKFGAAKKPKYEIFNHAKLAEKFGMIDLDSSRKTSGQGFYYLKGDLAILHSAILAFARDYMIKQGFEYVIPPFMIRSDVVEGVMSFEERDFMMYKIEGEDLYLIGTSEHSMIGMFKDKILPKKSLPYTMTSYSPCFRKEKGAHGLEERGLFRVHQFEKQEMIVVCEPEESYDWYNKMLKFTVDVFRALEIPVRILEICSGDLADLKAKSADVEAWSPRQKKYYEVGTCSNLTDAQARRLGIKIQGKDGNYFAHTLNNTVLASPRALIALIENNQQKDGSIKIPKVLWKYTGFKVIKK